MEMIEGGAMRNMLRQIVLLLALAATRVRGEGLPQSLPDQGGSCRPGPAGIDSRPVKAPRKEGSARVTEGKRGITWEQALTIAQHHIRAEHLEGCKFAVLSNQVDGKPDGWVFRMQEWDIVEWLCSGTPPPDNRSEVFIGRDGHVGQFSLETVHLVWRKCESAWRARHPTADPAIVWPHYGPLRFRPFSCPKTLDCNLLSD